jgi:hypothetical protein
MKLTQCKTLYAIVGAGLLSAATLILTHSPAAVLAFDKKLGQDVSGKNCERKDTSESSTFGKCENVCKDKEVTRDAANNRWVCNASKAVVHRPLGEKAPISDKALEPADNPTPKRQPPTGSKAGKAKKN